MESKAKLFWHAVHPILIVFPLGLFATAVVFDAILNRVTRTQNEDHLLKTIATPIAQQLQSAAVRQTQVEDDYVVTVLADGIPGRLTRLDPHGRVTVFGQILL